jgi:hypothetical protein
MSESVELREALIRISEIAEGAVRRRGDYNNNGDAADDGNYGICTPKSLPTDLQVKAADTACRINPTNAPSLAFAAAEDVVNLVSDPLHIAVLTTKYWGPAMRRLTVSFMESTPADLRARIVNHLNAWSCGVRFVETNGTGTVRISRGAGGYWSYLGTDVLHIAQNRQTMNLQGFSMNTSESEFRRVIRHEAGHTLGFPHEHMRREIVARIDPQKAYDYFWRTQGWSRAMVDQQVLTPLDNRSIFATAADQTSIMCYQLPGLITRDGRPVLGGPDINQTDLAFGRRIYPQLGPVHSQVIAPEDGDLQQSSYRDDSEFVLEPVGVE